MNKGVSTFKKTTGINSKVWASPNWRCSEDSLKLEDQLGFLYGADCRGKYPFIPVMNIWKAKTIQLPITLPCLHEIKQYLGTDNHDAIIRNLGSQIQSAFNVLCIHGYYEGVLARRLFTNLMRTINAENYKFVPLKELFEKIDQRNLPLCPVTKKVLPGGRGEISFQGRVC